jgi:hypothetical protein
MREVVSMDAANPRYADWKAPPDDGGHLIWPEPAQLLRDTISNNQLLATAHAARIQNVPLPELRSRFRKWSGHADDALPLIATGHQTELYHPGVWVKDALIHLAAEKLNGKARHVAVDLDEPKHLQLRWPGGSVPLVEKLNAASWSGLLDAPSAEHLAHIEQTIHAAAAEWNFDPMIGRFLVLMREGTGTKLAPALTRALQTIDHELGLQHDVSTFSPACVSEPYLVFVHHILSRAGDFAADYNAALGKYREEHKIRTLGRPMPNLDVSDDTCEVPFWLDDLATGHRFRASVVRMGDGWALPNPAARDDIFIFKSALDGWNAAAELLQWLERNNLRLSPRALTLTMFLRLLLADQFVHGIGGARYDQVTDHLIAAHFRIDPPRFAVTTATLYFPAAVGRSRACARCVAQEGHHLRHSVLGEEKRKLVEAIAGAPRGSNERSSLFFEMHGKLAAAARHPEILQWESRRVEAETREQEERVVFDRELFYALQSKDRLTTMIERYRADFA